MQIIDLTWIKKAPVVVGQGLRLNNARVITTVFIFREFDFYLLSQSFFYENIIIQRYCRNSSNTELVRRFLCNLQVLEECKLK